MNKQHPRTLTDNDVIDRFIETQSQDDFGILYSRYSNKVYSKCLSLLKNEVAAQDATQEIFLKIFLNLANFNRKSRFSTWVYSITYNFCIDYLRRKKKERMIVSDDQNVEGQDLEDDGDDKDLLEMEIDRLKTVLDLIPVEDKAVLLMKYREELSIREISHVFGKTESAIKMKIKRAKSKTRTVYKNLYETK